MTTRFQAHFTSPQRPRPARSPGVQCQRSPDRDARLPSPDVDASRRRLAGRRFGAPGPGLPQHGRGARPSRGAPGLGTSRGSRRRERLASGIAPFRIVQSAAVSKSDRPGGTLLHRRKCKTVPLPPICAPNRWRTSCLFAAHDKKAICRGLLRVGRAGLEPATDGL